MSRRDWMLPSDSSQSTSRRKFIQGASALVLANSQISSALNLQGRPKGGKVFAYVGTDTSAIDGKGNGKGIYLFEVDTSSGRLSFIKLAAEAKSPSWLCLDPSQRYLYASNEISDYEGKSGSVSAYAVDKSSGDLQLLNTISSQGAGPAYLSVDASGKYVFVANYGGGSLAVFPVSPDGSLGAATFTHRDEGDVGSQKATSGPPGSFAISGHDRPHAHMIGADPGNRFVLQTDLGQDRIYVYRLDRSTGKLTPGRNSVRVASLGRRAASLCISSQRAMAVFHSGGSLDGRVLSLRSCKWIDDRATNPFQSAERLYRDQFCLRHSSVTRRSHPVCRQSATQLHCRVFH